MKIISKTNKLTNFIKEQVLFTSFDGSQRTELSGEYFEDKKEIFESINSDYREDLLNILHSFTNIRASEKVLPIVDEVYEEGIIIRYFSEGLPRETPKSDAIVFVQQHKESQTVFVPFRIKSVPANERFYYLTNEAEIRQGILPEMPERFYFTVLETKKISKNMLRIFITSDVELPTNSSGFAYRFILNTLDDKTKLLNSLPFKMLEQIQTQVASFPSLSKTADKIKKQGAILAFEVLKRLPKQLESEEEKNGEEFNNIDESHNVETETIKDDNKKVDKKAGRYYTLRQLKNSPYAKNNSKNKYYGEVDVYLHGETAGGIWAESLKKGDIIYSNYEYEETIQNMTVGQALLICDETSMPSVAAVLERWQSPVTPIVISITNNQADCNYFDECEISEHIKDELQIIHIVPKTPADIAAMVIEKIESIDKQVDCAWGAIGASQSKQVKKYLREKYNLTGKLNRVRAYWS